MSSAVNSPANDHLYRRRALPGASRRVRKWRNPDLQAWSPALSGFQALAKRALTTAMRRRAAIRSACHERRLRAKPFRSIHASTLASLPAVEPTPSNLEGATIQHGHPNESATLFASPAASARAHDGQGCGLPRHAQGTRPAWLRRAACGSLAETFVRGQAFLADCWPNRNTLRTGPAIGPQTRNGVAKWTPKK